MHPTPHPPPPGPVFPPRPQLPSHPFTRPRRGFISRHAPHPQPAGHVISPPYTIDSRAKDNRAAPFRVDDFHEPVFQGGGAAAFFSSCNER
ncbi:hypothetical protein B0T21DRAFT_359358 [Apiosordaria backusii]|uniref:Uncharacterized protein n=1 Tax=Apiosordaria backusii TaxID=314023 RepID=A0AA40ETU0_9PEZI|nr:hypothetical protein B0T21DRAFT_359358 [Apiosordaria backusii]